MLWKFLEIIKEYDIMNFGDECNLAENNFLLKEGTLYWKIKIFINRRII